MHYVIKSLLPHHHHIVLGEEGVAFFGSIVSIGLNVFEADEGLLVDGLTTEHHRRNYPS